MATARRASRLRLRRARVSRILVVCYGNIYRSAFVGALLRSRLPAAVEVRSAGFHPVSGRPSPQRHVQVSRRYGVSLENHRSVVVTAADAQWADVIVLMDRHNWAALNALGAATEKLIWLGGLLSGPVEILDPYTLDDRQAELIVARLRDATEQLIATISDQPAMREP